MAEWEKRPAYWNKRDFSGFRTHIKAYLQDLEKEIWTCIYTGLKAAQSYEEIFELQNIMTTKTGLSEEPALRIIYEQKRKKANASGATNEAGREILRNGCIYVRPFPWMTHAMVQRQDNAIQATKKHLEKTSGGRCTLAKSAIHSGFEQEAGTPDAYGVFAARPLRKGESLLADTTVVAIVDKPNTCPTCLRILDNNRKPIKLDCCTAQYCSRSCADKSVACFHKAVCGKTFQLPDIEKLPTEPRKSILLLLRVLAIIAQADTFQNRSPKNHPLFDPTIDCLTPNYSPDPDSWTYKVDILYTTQILQTLGIDIFADLRYDTWVIRTIRNRLRNNFNGVEEGIDNCCINQLYSMFNHSCHPNVTWHYNEAIPSSIYMQADRDIKVREELSITYCGDLRFVGPMERKTIFEPWNSYGCGCVRCEVEIRGTRAECVQYYRQYLKTCPKEEREILLKIL
jgi:hypothetical protein